MERRKIINRTELIKCIVRDNGVCQECGKTIKEPHEMILHHIIPVSAGGSNESTNLVTLCHRCHMEAHGFDASVDCVLIRGACVKKESGCFVVKTNKVGNGAIRVTIPSPIRDELGIKAGDILDVALGENSIIMVKADCDQKR